MACSVQGAIAMAIGNRPTFMGFSAEFAATRIGMTWPIPPKMFESST